MGIENSNAHYLPAALIGGFGEAPRRGRHARSLRNAKVAVRYTSQPDAVHARVRADSIAREKGIYRLKNPPAGVDRDEIDRLWSSYEPRLPAAVRALEAGRKHVRDSDWSTIRAHLYGLAVRHPDFDKRARTFLLEQGVPDPHPDLVQHERVRTLRETPKLLAACRFALLRSGDASRFIVNDKGYTTVKDESDHRGILFPLSGSVAILAAVDVGMISGRPEAWLSGEGLLTPGATELLNEAAWRQPGIRCVIGHPRDAMRLRNLGVQRDLVMPILGPYGSRGTDGLFDWAFAPEHPTTR
ncbi:MAG TPA: DUF4238 domain-containing protein [Acidimicrobiales bacterium]|nr:DUF4238 domain-containing protein [Acidimicrobiales bacterium]